jgi:hypothetical protein
MEHKLKRGGRVMVVFSHRSMPGRFGTVKEIQDRIGNRFLVKFDRDELGMWHDGDGEPVLRLGGNDLVLVEENQGLAA